MPLVYIINMLSHVYTHYTIHLYTRIRIRIQIQMMCLERRWLLYGQTLKTPCKKWAGLGAPVTGWIRSRRGLEGGDIGTCWEKGHNYDSSPGWIRSRRGLEGGDIEACWEKGDNYDSSPGWIRSWRGLEGGDIEACWEKGHNSDSYIWYLLHLFIPYKA